jgi:hypothetical protein
LLGLAGAGERYQAGLDVLFDASQAKSATKASSGASTKGPRMEESIDFLAGSGRKGIDKIELT